MVLLHRVVYSVFLLPGIYVHERNRGCFSEGGGAWKVHNPPNRWQHRTARMGTYHCLSSLYLPNKRHL